MHTRIRTLLALFAGLAFASAASANVVTSWTLQGFSFLSGGFTYDSTLHELTDWNITAAAGNVSGANIPPTVAVTAFTYTPLNSGTCIGGVPGGSFYVSGGIKINSCGTHGSDITLLFAGGAGALDLPGGGIVPVSVAAQLVDPAISTAITPTCTSSNDPNFPPCLAYARYDYGGQLIGGPTSVPEPASMALLGIGLLGLARARRNNSRCSPQR